MKTEWWYDDATYYSDPTELFLARLVVRDDGTAQILTDGERLEFENETEASIWFLDEEYRRMKSLLEDFEDEGATPDPRIKPPEAATEEELQRRMVIRLTPGAAAPSVPAPETTSPEYHTPAS